MVLASAARWLDVTHRHLERHPAGDHWEYQSGDWLLTRREQGAFTAPEDAVLTSDVLAPDPADLHFGFQLSVRGPFPGLTALRAQVAERIAGVPLLTHRLRRCGRAVVLAAVGSLPGPSRP
ncbi:hypothetical protein DF268_19915 [Streptomyces sp. V2]|uniref:hypothetical protein n=1 Tax=Streptomyces TaxID=1883 RepID=UPI0006EB4723|nr:MULTISPECIES: hypothetical protein [Streptomyces]PWG11824.1 hypothetical protein DF268_19915 [Streptomyces sp. V2]